MMWSAGSVTRRRVLQEAARGVGRAWRGGEPAASSATLDLPRFLVEACEALQPHLGTPGLFRTAGSVARIRALQARVAGGAPCLGVAAPCDVAALLKRFLRELPEPLVPPALQEPLCQAQRQPDPHRAPLTLLLTGLLPRARALRYLCCFLRRVAARCDENKMDAANLAVIFVPTLFPGPSWGLRLQLQAAAVQTLIQEAPSIGRVPRALLDELLAPEVAEETPRPRCGDGPAPVLPPKRKAWGAPSSCGKRRPAADEAVDRFEEPLGAEPAPEPRSLGWDPEQEPPGGMQQPAPIAPWDTWVPEPSSWCQMKKMVAKALWPPGVPQCPPCGLSGDLRPEDQAAPLHRRLRRSLSWPEDLRRPAAPALPSPSQGPEVGLCPSGCLCSSWRSRRSRSHEGTQGARARRVRAVLQACGRLLPWRRGRKPRGSPGWAGTPGAVHVMLRGSCMFPV